MRPHTLVPGCAAQGGFNARAGVAFRGICGTGGGGHLQPSAALTTTPPTGRFKGPHEIRAAESDEGLGQRFRAAEGGGVVWGGHHKQTAGLSALTGCRETTHTGVCVCVRGQGRHLLQG